MLNPYGNEEDIHFLEMKKFKTVSPIAVVMENMQQLNKIYQFKPLLDESLLGCVKCGKNRRYLFNTLQLHNLEKHID